MKLFTGEALFVRGVHDVPIFQQHRARVVRVVEPEDSKRFGGHQRERESVTARQRARRAGVQCLTIAQGQ